mgnify:CR=1 FL=1
MARRTIMIVLLAAAAAVVVAIFRSGSLIEASVLQGLQAMRAVDVPSGGTLRDRVEASTRFLISFLALAAVVAVVVAGFMLVFSVGSDTTIQRARKTVIAALGGIIVVYLAAALVRFVLQVAGT